LVATSAAVAPQTARYPAPRCGEAGQGLLGQYDTHGNLWVGRSASNFVGPINVFLRDAPTGRRARLEGGCSATDPASGEARSWAFPCTADLDVAPAATQAGSVGWLHPWAVNMVEDEATGAMFVVGSNGAVGVIERTPSRHGVTFTSRSMRSLGIDRLPPLQPDEFLRMPSKGIVDVQRRALWVPVTTAEVIDPAGCDFWSCNPVTGKRRSHYLYRVDLEQTIGSAPHAQYARAPSSVRVGKGFSIRVTTTYAEPLDRANSDLSLYEQDSATPLVRIPWRRACNRRGSCSYRAKVPASATAAMADQKLSWHAVVCEESGRNSLHTTGVISVVQ